MTVCVCALLSSRPFEKAWEGQRILTNCSEVTAVYCEPPNRFIMLCICCARQEADEPEPFHSIDVHMEEGFGCLRVREAHLVLRAMNLLQAPTTQSMRGGHSKMGLLSRRGCAHRALSHRVNLAVVN